ICALLFVGEISVSLPPSQFFADSSFFTTDSEKIAKNVCDNVYTVAGLIGSLGGRAENYGDLSGLFHGINGDKPDTAVPQRKKRKRLSVFRKVMLSL
ncbi:ABC transporter ATP-binding protein, partial [[Eubacterium] siraeum]|nr:ABC transporter ATP-binding protein [[Eubacterium] siraeum]